MKAKRWGVEKGQQREMEERRKRDGSSVGGDAEMRMSRGKASAPNLSSAFCLAEQEPPESRTTTPTGVDEREMGSGDEGCTGAGVGG